MGPTVRSAGTPTRRQGRGPRARRGTGRRPRRRRRRRARAPRRGSRGSRSMKPVSNDPSRNPAASQSAFRKARFVFGPATTVSPSASASFASASSRRRAMGDDLRDHRIVVGRHHVARLDAGIDAEALAVGKAERPELARRGQEAPLRVLGVEPRLDRVAVDRELGLRRTAAARPRRRGTAARRDRAR